MTSNEVLGRETGLGASGRGRLGCLLQDMPDKRVPCLSSLSLDLSGEREGHVFQ